MLVYVKKFKFYNLGIVLLLILQNLLLLCSTFATMLSARLMMEGNLKKLMSYLLIIILLYVILNFIFWIYDIMVAKTVALMNQEVRKDLNRKLMSRSSEQFMQSDIGEYLSWYTNDVKETENQGFMNLYEVIDYTIKLVLGTIVLFLIKIELLICTLAVTGTVFFVSRHFEKGVEETSNKVSKAMERFTSIVKEQVSGFRVLKYFGHTQKFTDDIDNAAEKLEAQRFTYAVEKEKAGLKLKMLNTVGSFINNLVLFGMCALRIIPAEIFFGGGNLTNQVKSSLIGLSQCRMLLAGARPYFKKLIEREAVDQIQGTEELPEVKSSIQIKDLSFGYHEKPVIQNLHLDFLIGGKYAIVGKSGCGKSTLLKLLMGQLNGYSGEILFDGKNIKEYAPDSFYLRMAYIEQNVFLFHASIRENITLGQNFSEQEMDNALKKSALIQDMNHFPQGLDTDVGENGSHLSGGQKQRVAIARALIHNRSILIVDEGTSALDQENASAIEDSLLECPDLTLLLVSHHLRPEKTKSYTRVYHLSSEKGA